jgi:hypothetical protein
MVRNDLVSRTKEHNQGYLLADRKLEIIEFLSN